MGCHSVWACLMFFWWLDNANREFLLFLPVARIVRQDLKVSHAHYKSSCCFGCSVNDLRSDVYKDWGGNLIIKMCALKPGIQTSFVWCQ